MILPWPLAASMWRTVQAIPAAVIVHILCHYEAKWICITTPVPPTRLERFEDREYMEI